MSLSFVSVSLSSHLTLPLENPGEVGVARIRGTLSRPLPTCRQHPEVPEPRGCAPATSREAGDETQEV